LAGLGLCLGPAQSFAIPPAQDKNSKALRFGIISDLHHLQFGAKDDEVPRLKAFMDAVLKESPDFIIQNGDFCRPKGIADIMAEWNRFAGPKYHVLGNHDMDVCDKATIMKLWGMERPYYSFDQGGYHFVVMDRNFIRQADGTYLDYARSNWGADVTRSFTNPEQLNWLRQDLAAAKSPVIVFMHQPVFLSDYFKEIGNAGEILTVFDEANYAAAKTGSAGRVAAVFMGHDHDDRHGERNGVHYFMVNSSSYAYHGGAYYYEDPLFAFVTLEPSGKLIIEGRSSAYRGNTPEAIKSAFPVKISNQEIQLLA